MGEMEFNDDGSLKVPEGRVKELVDDEKIFKNEPSIIITKNQISMENPARCELIIELSKNVEKPERIKGVFNLCTGKFKHMAQLVMSDVKENKYKVSIVSGQYRCSWCTNFMDFIAKEMDVKILGRGSCLSYVKANILK